MRTQKHELQLFILYMDLVFIFCLLYAFNNYPSFDNFLELTIQKSVILTSRESLVTFNNETKCEIDKILLINLEV